MELTELINILVERAYHDDDYSANMTLDGVLHNLNEHKRPFIDSNWKQYKRIKKHHR